MKKIRLLGVAMALILTVSMLAACGGSGGNTTTAAGGDTPATQGTASGGGEVSGDAIELKIAHNNAITSPTAIAIQDWADKVYEATGGTVVITQYPSDSLGATTSGLDMLDTGITDLFWSTTGMFAGTFNYLDTFALPMLGQTSSVGGTKAIWDIYEQDQWKSKIDDDFVGTKVLIAYQSEGGVIGSNDKVESVADLKGDVVRSIAGGVASFVEDCGASPTFMGPGDIYTNLQKGVINDYIFEWAGVQNFTLAELTPYFLNMNLYRVPMFILISDAAWNKLSADQQEAILSVSLREGSLEFAEKNDATEESYIEESVASGNTEIVVPTAEAEAEFKTVAEGVWAKWVGDKVEQEYFDAVQDSIAKNQ